MVVGFIKEKWRGAKVVAVGVAISTAWLGLVRFEHDLERFASKALHDKRPAAVVRKHRSSMKKLLSYLQLMGDSLITKKGLKSQIESLHTKVHNKEKVVSEAKVRIEAAQKLRAETLKLERSLKAELRRLSGETITDAQRRSISEKIREIGTKRKDTLQLIHLALPVMRKANEDFARIRSEFVAMFVVTDKDAEMPEGAGMLKKEGLDSFALCFEDIFEDLDAQVKAAESIQISMEQFSVDQRLIDAIMNQ